MRENRHSAIAKVLDCSLEVSEFKLQLHNCIHFQTNAHRKHQNTFTALMMSYRVSQLFFYKDDFGIIK